MGETRRSGDIHIWADGTNRIELLEPRKGVMLYRAVGRYTGPLLTRVLDTFDQMTQSMPGPYHAFADLWDLSGYDTEVRVRATEWFKPRKKIMTFHVLFSSKLVAMGLSTITLLAGMPMTTYSEQAVFDDAVSRLIGTANPLRIVTPT